MESQRNLYSIILTVLFACFLFIVPANDLIHFYTPSEISTTENRYLEKKPKMVITNLDAFPKPYSRFFNDHFPFRKELLRFYGGEIEFRIFNRSPYPKKVHLGRSGWMFVGSEKAIYDGSHKLTSAQIDEIVRQLQVRAAFYTRNGSKFYLAIPPMKSEIHSEYLPSGYFRDPTGTNTDKIIQAIKKDPLIGYIELKKPLLLAKDSMKLYYQADNHWNYRGGFCAYSEILNRMKQDFPGLNALTTEDVAFVPVTEKGKNLAMLMDIPDFAAEQDWLVKVKKVRSADGRPAGYTPRPDFAYKSEYEIVKVVKDSALPTIVVIRDSFFYGILPFISENFRKSVYIYDTGVYAIHEEVIGKEKPDIVLLLIYEPHLQDIIGIPF